jgi:hypothetical protein
LKRRNSILNPITARLRHFPDSALPGWEIDIDKKTEYIKLNGYLKQLKRTVPNNRVGLPIILIYDSMKTEAYLHMNKKNGNYWVAGTGWATANSLSKSLLFLNHYVTNKHINPPAYILLSPVSGLTFQID